MRKKFGKYFLSFAGVNLASFLLYYLSTYLLQNDAVEYVRYFIGEAVDFALPVVAAALVSSSLASHGFSAMWLVPIISLGRITYAYPYYYLYLVEGRVLTDEALLLAIPYSLASVILDCLIVFVLVFVIYLVTVLLAGKRRRDFGQSVDAIKSPFDFSSEYTVGLLVGSLCIFAVKLIAEIIDAVTYIVEYKGSYSYGEIVYMVVSFVMLAAELLLAHYVAVRVARDNHKK